MLTFTSPDSPKTRSLAVRQRVTVSPFAIVISLDVLMLMPPRAAFLSVPRKNWRQS
jgi:hypothetical protein